MTKDEFLSRFTLLQLPESEHNYQHNSELRAAAVLIVLIEPEKQGKLDVLFTKRASHLKHHPSQISFPGGKTEKEDKSPIATALRETYEEIGIAPELLNVVGQLPAYQTVSGFYITPIIALASKLQIYNIDKNEVDEIFHVPLQHFIGTENHHVLSVRKGGLQHKVHFFPYQGRNIWGATAVILKDLVKQLT